MDKILEVKNLRVSFRTNSGILKAVRDISFDLERGKTLAIVGESGSGKSVTSKAILGILAGNSIVEGGEILYDGKDLLKISEDDMYKIRGDKISMIFQDPLSSLNPIVKIGKQLTEAMLLKNKVNRKESRAEFNALLKLLKDNMTEATGETQRIADMTETFDKFNIEGIKLENEYNIAFAAAEELIADIEDLLFKAEKKQKTDIRGYLTDISKKLSTVKNGFLTAAYDRDRKELVLELQKAARSYKKQGKKEDGNLNPETETLLRRVQSVLRAVTEQERPDFFRLGYYKMKHPEENLFGRDIRQLNETALACLDDGFMKEFIEAAAKGMDHSYRKALEKKKNVLVQLEQARQFYAGEYDRKQAQNQCKELTRQVNESIDRLELQKDSLVYTFGTSLSEAIDKYFSARKNNPREEKRFARQTARREKKIARGKTVEWKVVPKVVYDLEELKGEILHTIDRLTARYEEYIGTADTADMHARSVGMVDYLKEKASQVVYRVTKIMAKEKAIRLMEEVGIPEPRERYYQYPFEFSGGMRQRIVIAIALAADPDILICDEPTTALDVTIQAQILELINKLKEERNLSVIFITHDLGVVANMADEIAVMYAGKIVEYGTADDIFYDPRHPYTWALLSSMPDLETNEKLEAIPGTPPNLVYPPVGDAFAERNKYAMQIDFEMQPPMFEVSSTHKAATWLLHPKAPKVEMPKIITDRIARAKKQEVSGNE